MKKIITSVFSMAIAAALAGQIPQNGLVAHFDCNGIVGTNSNKNGNIIQPNNYSSNTLSGGKTKPVPGLNRYNETDSSLTCEYTGYHYNMNYKQSGVNNTALKIKKQITFGCWVMLNGYNQYNLSPLVFGAFGPQYASYAIQGNLNNGNFYVMVSSNLAVNQKIGINLSNEGTGGTIYFRHIMATIGADDTLRMYYQGKQTGAIKFLGDSIQYYNHANSNPYFSIGADFVNNGWNGTGLDGSVDDVVVYDRALSKEEIWTLFNNSNKCTNSYAAKPGHLNRSLSGSVHLLKMADSTVWHNDNCEFEWYKDGQYGLTTKRASGNTISITKNGTYKVKVVNQATRCWYWTNEIVVTDLNNSNGLRSMENSQVRIYPNPSQNIINVTGIKFIDEISIIETNGKTAISLKNVNSKDCQIDISSLSSGVYLVQIKSDNTCSTQRLIKE